MNIYRLRIFSSFLSRSKQNPNPTDLGRRHVAGIRGVGGGWGEGAGLQEPVFGSILMKHCGPDPNLPWFVIQMAVPRSLLLNLVSDSAHVLKGRFLAWLFDCEFNYKSCPSCEGMKASQLN